MTSQEFLDANKDLLIGAILHKINRLEQKVRWSEKNEPGHERIEHRKEKIEKYKELLNQLENGIVH